MEPTTSEIAEELRAAVGEFVRAARTFEELTGSQMAVLGRLDREGSATIAELASIAQVRHQSATKLVAQLEAAGAVEISAHPTDGRAVQVHITDRGAEVIRAERERRAAWIADAMETQLSPAERQQLAAAAALLNRLSGVAAATDTARTPRQRSR